MLCCAILCCVVLCYMMYIIGKLAERQDCTIGQFGKLVKLVAEGKEDLIEDKEFLRGAFSVVLCCVVCKL